MTMSNSVFEPAENKWPTYSETAAPEYRSNSNTRWVFIIVLALALVALTCVGFFAFKKAQRANRPVVRRPQRTQQPRPTRGFRREQVTRCDRRMGRLGGASDDAGEPGQAQSSAGSTEIC